MNFEKMIYAASDETVDALRMLVRKQTSFNRVEQLISLQQKTYTLKLLVHIEMQ